MQIVSWKFTAMPFQDDLSCQFTGIAAIVDSKIYAFFLIKHKYKFWKMCNAYDI